MTGERVQKEEKKEKEKEEKEKKDEVKENWCGTGGWTGRRLYKRSSQT